MRRVRFGSKADISTGGHTAPAQTSANGQRRTWATSSRALKQREVFCGFGGVVHETGGVGIDHDPFA